MLEETPRTPRERCLTITDLPERVTPFFQALLGEWGYDVERRADGLVLVRAGHRRARETDPAEPLELSAPINMPELWSRVESRFHATPRRHIRLRCELPADLSFAGMRIESRFISISDAGGRLTFPRELIRGESGRVRFTLGGDYFDTPCEVIYVLPKREWEKSPGTEIGVVFRWPDPQDLRRTRQLIVRHYLESVAARLSAEDYRAGLDFTGGPEAF